MGEEFPHEQLGVEEILVPFPRSSGKGRVAIRFLPRDPTGLRWTMKPDEMNDELSPVQKRSLVLLRECGLEFEEAMYALGRRTGGLPEYRRLTRQEQFNKVQELIGCGLTQEESERVVGMFREVRPVDVKPPNSHAGPKHPLPKWTANQPLVSCYRCRKSDSTLAQIEGGAWLCRKCRRQLKAAVKAQKHRREVAASYDALAHPELRGLKGVRK